MENKNDRTPLAALEETSVFLRTLTVNLAGLYSLAPDGPIKLDIGASLVNARDVLAWVEARLQEFNTATKDKPLSSEKQIH